MRLNTAVKKYLELEEYNTLLNEGHITAFLECFKSAEEEAVRLARAQFECASTNQAIQEKRHTINQNTVLRAMMMSVLKAYLMQNSGDVRLATAIYRVSQRDGVVDNAALLRSAKNGLKEPLTFADFLRRINEEASTRSWLGVEALETVQQITDAVARIESARVV